MANPDEIMAFLLAFKQEITNGGLSVVPRIENRDALIELGLTKRDRVNIVLGLTLADYCSGPEPDRNRRGEVWFFGKAINGIIVYIKLQLQEYRPVGTNKDVRVAVCISFHRAKRPISFPYS